MKGGCPVKYIITGGVTHKKNKIQSIEKVETNRTNKKICLRIVYHSLAFFAFDVLVIQLFFMFAVCLCFVRKITLEF